MKYWAMQGKRRTGQHSDLHKIESHRAAEQGVSSKYEDIKHKGIIQMTPQIKWGPLTVGSSEADVHHTHQIKQDARKRLPGEARNFVDLSFSASQNGANTANKPKDPIARENFNRALAGNLLWAATSLFVEWNPAVIVMSFIGASIGSGVASKSSNVIGQGEAMIADRLAQEADNLEATVTPIAQATADECGEKQIYDYEDQNKLLWRNLFPRSSSHAGISWETKRETLTRLSRQRVEGALTDFIKQWEKWNEKIVECAIRKNPIYFLEFRKKCESENPFSPVLTFEKE